MEDLDAALNTYRVLILDENPYNMFDINSTMSFLIDVTDYPYLDHDSRLVGAENTLDVLSVYEHYEKCSDLQEYIKELKDEIQRLSTKNN
jgi:uncharacterized small protein (DUF1192 family)